MHQSFVLFVAEVIDVLSESCENEDTSSTNLYVGNISPKVNML